MSLLAAAASQQVTHIQSNNSEAAILTLAIPLGVFCAMLFWGFFQRRQAK